MPNRKELPVKLVKQITLILALCAIAGCAIFLLWLKAHQKLGNPGVKTVLPEVVLGYNSTNNPITKIEADMLPKDTTLVRRIYHAESDGKTNELLMSLVLMGTDRTSIHKPQYCLTGQGWQIVHTEKRSIAIQKPHPYELPVMKLIASKTVQLPDGKTYTAKAVYVYWFVADGVLASEHGERIWSMMTHLLSTGELQRWAYVSCFAVCYSGQEENTYKELERFIVASAPEFHIAPGKTPGLVRAN